jgi:uncharacterized Zn-finger protein
MTYKSDAIEKLKTYLEAGQSVCPYAKKAELHYAMANEALGQLLTGFKRYEAAVVIADKEPGDFWATKRWAQDTLIKMFVTMAGIGNPEWSHRQCREHVYTHIAPTLRDDNNPRMVSLAVRNKAVITICMGPVYPMSHPRYLPLSALILTWYDDLHEVALSGVRDIMKREHGHVYDALELMLPLPRGVAVGKTIPVQEEGDARDV